MKRTDVDYIQDILDSINTIEKYVPSGASYEDFINDERNYHTVIRMFEIIGEACNKISAEIKEKYPEIQWRDIIGMRNKVIHQYFGVNPVIVWKAATDDVPELKYFLAKLVKEIDNEII